VHQYQKPVPENGHHFSDSFFLPDETGSVPGTEPDFGTRNNRYRFAWHTCRKPVKVFGNGFWCMCHWHKINFRQCGKYGKNSKSHKDKKIKNWLFFYTGTTVPNSFYSNKNKKQHNLYKQTTQLAIVWPISTRHFGREYWFPAPSRTLFYSVPDFGARKNGYRFAWHTCGKPVEVFHNGFWYMWHWHKIDFRLCGKYGKNNNKSHDSKKIKIRTHRTRT